MVAGNLCAELQSIGETIPEEQAGPDRFKLHRHLGLRFTVPGNAGRIRRFQPHIEIALTKHRRPLARHGQDQLVQRLKVSDWKRAETFRSGSTRKDTQKCKEAETMNGVPQEQPRPFTQWHLVGKV